MKQWFLKTFRKDKVVKLHVVFPDRRVKNYYVIPTSVDNAGVCNVKKVGSFIIQKDHQMLSSKNIPTYYFNYTNTESINLFDTRESIYTAEDYDTALYSKAKTDFLKYAKKSQISQDTMILLVAMFVGFAGLGYFLSNQISQVIEILRSLGVV